MSDLFLDYTEKQRLPLRRKRLLYGVGVIVFVGGVVLLIHQIVDPIGLSFSISAAVNILLGLTFILQAMELRIMYPEKFLRITPEHIEYKLGNFSKLKKIQWKAIDKISITKKAIEFVSNEETNCLKMINFPSSDEKRLKATINAIAESKGL